jgi:lipopolysaccharide transport protein LptA
MSGRPSKGLLPALLLGLCFQAWDPVLGETPSPLSTNDTLVVRADEALEDGTGRAVHLAGRVEIQAPTWTARGERATLYGDPEDPRGVVMEGAPASVKVLRSKDGILVEAEGKYIEYWRETDSIRLRGGGVVKDGERTIRGDSMTYSIETKRYSAGGEGRVRVLTEP